MRLQESRWAVGSKGGGTFTHTSQCLTKVDIDAIPLRSIKAAAGSISIFWLVNRYGDSYIWVVWLPPDKPL